MVGIELAPGNNQIGVFFEEFELPAEMVLMDSFNTTNQDVLVIGEEEDPFFGKTAATGYSRLYINTSISKPGADALLDSAFFSLDVVGLNGTNLSQPKYFSVHKLQENILDTTYYNFDALQYKDEAFASGEVVFGETTDSLVSLDVEDAFAEEIFNLLKEGNVFNDIFSFRDYFPGVAIKGREGDDTSISVGLGAKTGLTVYYHNAGDTASKAYTISTQNSRNFSGIQNDRSGTPTEAITEYQKSYDVGSLVGMKSGLGMVIKLDTSPFDAFLDTLVGVTFNQVALEIGEIEDPVEGMVPISYFRAYFADASNHFLANPAGLYYTLQEANMPQVAINSDSNKEPQVGAPASFIYMSDKRLYSQDISSYVNAVFRGDLARKDWILYGGNIVDKRRTILGTDPFAPSRRTADPFVYSLRQMKVDKSKIKVKVFYSKSR